MKTGTPILLNCSARTQRVTVFPVPVAPVIRPWRFAIFGIRKMLFFPFAIKRGDGVVVILFPIIELNGIPEMKYISERFRPSISVLYFHHPQHQCWSFLTGEGT